MPLLFADDTSVFASGTNIIQLQEDATNDLNSAEWLKVNWLSLNIKIFSNKNSLNLIQTLKWKGGSLKRLTGPSFLEKLLITSYHGNFIFHIYLEK